MSEFPRLNIDEMTSRRGILFLLTLILFFAPGIVILFVYYQELFKDLETMKVLMLSTALTMPSFLVIFLSAGTELAESMQDDDEYFHFHSVTLSSMITSIALYFALGISYWRGYSFNKFLLAEVIMTVFSVIVCRVINRILKAQESEEKEAK
jgi:hypothetical protein